MSGRPWYKRCGADFIEGTMGLTLEEKGAYSMVLDLIYSHGGPIADDPRWIAGICSVSVRKWLSLKNRLIEVGKIVVTDGRIANPRADKELFSASETQRKQAENGSKGGRKTAENRTTSNENNNLAEATLQPIDKIREEEISLREREAPKDPRKALWEDGSRILSAKSGMPERKAKGLVGKWLKDANDDAARVLAKIRQAEADDALDIVSWVTAAIQAPKRNWRDEPEYRGVHIL